MYNKPPLKRLENDKNILMLLADKRRVTVTFVKGDYHDKMNDKQIYEELKRDLAPAIQCNLNNKLLTLKLTDAIDFVLYNRVEVFWTVLDFGPLGLDLGFLG